MAASKNFLRQYQIITSGSMTGTTVITSATTDISFLDNIAMEVVWTGTPTGTLEVQGSITGTNWKTLSFTPASQPAGAAGNLLFDLNFLSFPKIRLIYTNASGTGTLNAYIAGKGL